MPQFMTYEMKNSTILRLYSIRKEIGTSPEYQRNPEIWNPEKRRLLIDSILNDYDIPKLYFHAFRTPRKLPDGEVVSYAIIDGKQRVETIWAFMEDGFALADDFELYRDPKVKAGGLKYSEISTEYPQLKVWFDSFVLPIICVETDDIELIQDMFSRLNEAVPLNAAERRNAIGGPMARMINEIAEHRFFMTNVKFSNKRYQHREVAVRILFLEHCLFGNRIVDTKRMYLDAFVWMYKEQPSLDPNKPGDAVKRVLNEMAKLFREQDDLLRARANVVIYYLLFRSALKQGRLAEITVERLEAFTKKVDENRRIAEEDITKSDFELLEFDRFSIQGTNDASSIKERLGIISKHLGIGELTYA